MQWRFFLGACILAAGVLMKAGAPAPAVVGGLVFAAALNWRAQRTN